MTGKATPFDALLGSAIVVADTLCPRTFVLAGRVITDAAQIPALLDLPNLCEDARCAAFDLADFLRHAKAVEQSLNQPPRDAAADAERKRKSRAKYSREELAAMQRAWYARNRERVATKRREKRLATVEQRP